MPMRRRNSAGYYRRLDQYIHYAYSQYQGDMLPNGNAAHVRETRMPFPCSNYPTCNQRATIDGECNDCAPRCEYEGCLNRVRDGIVWNYAHTQSYEWCGMHIRQAARRCSDCGEFHTAMAGETGDGYTLCDICWSDNTMWCDDCDEAFRYIDDHRCRQARHRAVHSWDYIPYFIHHGTGPVYLGLELEVAVPADLTAQWVNDNFDGDLYCKHDGSIEPEGYEIVSHPRSWVSWQLWQDRLVELTTELAKHGQAGPNGIHVHISREAFVDTDHAVRWLELIHMNQERMSAYARRYAPRWARFHELDYLRNVITQNWSGNGKYVAVNTYHQRTYEVRCFASSLDVEEIMGAIGFVAASAEYTSNPSNPIDWDDFAVWCMGREEYHVVAAQVYKSNDRLPEMVDLFAAHAATEARFREERVRPRRFSDPPTFRLDNDYSYDLGIEADRFGAADNEYALLVNNEHVGTYSLDESEYESLQNLMLRPITRESAVRAFEGMLGNQPITLRVSDNVSNGNEITIDFDEDFV